MNIFVGRVGSDVKLMMSKVGIAVRGVCKAHERKLAWGAKLLGSEAEQTGYFGVILAFSTSQYHVGSNNYEQIINKIKL